MPLAIAKVLSDHCTRLEATTSQGCGPCVELKRALAGDGFGYGTPVLPVPSVGPVGKFADNKTGGVGSVFTQCNNYRFAIIRYI